MEVPQNCTKAQYWSKCTFNHCSVHSTASAERGTRERMSVTDNNLSAGCISTKLFLQHFRDRACADWIMRCRGVVALCFHLSWQLAETDLSIE